MPHELEIFESENRRSVCLPGFWGRQSRVAVRADGVCDLPARRPDEDENKEHEELHRTDARVTDLHGPQTFT